MDMKRLLEKMDQFAGQDVGQKPGDQVRGTEKATKKKSGEHPFKGRLVGASESVLKDLDKQIAEGEQERSLLEDYERFSRDWCGICGQSPCNCTTISESEKKGLYYYVNRRKKAGTSRPKNHPKAPSAQDWKNAAKTAKKESIAEDAEPIDREWALVKKLGRLGERIVQNPKLWSKYTEAIDTENLDWIISLIQEGTGADKGEVMRLSKLFGDIGGGTGRIVDFAWAVKEGHWQEDFLKPYRQHRAQGVAEGFKNTYSVGDRVDGPLGTGTIVAVSKNVNVDGRVKVKLDDPSRAGEDGKYKDSFVLDTTQLKHISEQGVAEGIEIVDQDSDLDQQVYTLNVDGNKVSFTYWDYENNFQSPDIKDIYQQATEQLGRKLSPDQIKDVARAVFKSFEQGVAEAFIAPALSAANAAAEFRRQGQAGSGYRGRIDMPVTSQEEYLEVGRALKRAAKLKGQHIEYGLSDGTMSVFSDTMDSVTLDEFIDMALSDLQEGTEEDKPLAPMPKSLIGGPRFSGGQRQVTPMPKSLTGGPRFSGGGGYTGKGVAEGNRGLSKRQETEFHAKLDKLVHDTFGKRKGEMAEEAVPPSVPTAGGPAGAGQQKQQNPEQAALLKKQQASMQQNLANLKTAGVDIDPAKAAQSLQKTDTGAPMNAMDKDTIAKLAPALGNVMSNPSTASQLNTLIKKAGGGA